MPAADSPIVIVARFLKANHYNDTYDSFVRESGLSPETDVFENGALSIEKVLEEKQIFDLSLRFERTGVEEDGKGWNYLAPVNPFPVSDLPTSSNILCVSLEDFGSPTSGESWQLLVVTTADRYYHTFTPGEPLRKEVSRNDLQDSPILSSAFLSTSQLVSITAGMSGQVIIHDLKNNKTISERRDHKKYVVKVERCIQEDNIWVATASWDNKIFLYTTSKGQSYALSKPVAVIATSTNPETVSFLLPPGKSDLVLLVTRRDSTHLYYYAVPTVEDVKNPEVTRPKELQLLGKQNLMPNSNAWVSSSPASVSICPTDPGVLAVGIASVPHMKLIVVRILWSCMARSGEPPQGRPAQARTERDLKDSEDAAILLHVNTFAPQTPYSTPACVWRPDGSGLWVNGDDGALRGIEAKSGKVVSTLKGGHDEGSKIRSICTGHVQIDGKKEEWLVSGGFDQKLIVWKPEEISTNSFT